IGINADDSMQINAELKSGGKTVGFSGNFATSDNENNHFTINGNLQLDSDVHFSTDNETNDGNIIFYNGSVEDKIADTHTLTLDAGTEGTINFQSAIGETGRLNSLTIDEGKDINFSSTIKTKNLNISAHNSIQVGGNATIEGDVIISGKTFDNASGIIDTSAAGGKIGINADDSMQINAELKSGAGDIELGKTSTGEIQLAANLTNSSDIELASNAKMINQNVVINAGESITVQQINSTDGQSSNLDLISPLIKLKGDLAISGILNGSELNEQVDLDIAGQIKDAIDVVKTDGTVNLAAGVYDEKVEINKNVNLNVASGTAIAKSWKLISDKTVTLNGNYATSDIENNDFTFEGNVLVKDQVSLSTDNTANDGNIIFNKAIDANTNEATTNLTLKAGVGNVNMNGASGVGTAIDNLTVQSASQAVFDAIKTKGDINITADTTSLQKTVNSQGSVNISGNLELSDSIITTGKDISLNTVKVNGTDINLDTGAESSGNIQINGKLNGTTVDTDVISLNAG
ncbi:hypothetical protein MHK_003457, partial [Candidatus Magnetomorum sp. HK-1]